MHREALVLINGPSTRWNMGFSRFLMRGGLQLKYMINGIGAFGMPHSPRIKILCIISKIDFPRG